MAAKLLIEGETNDPTAALTSESYRTDPEEPPAIGHAIVVGPASLQSADGSKLSLEAYKPINLEGISRIWHDILVWHCDFTEARGAAKLPGGFKDVLAEIGKSETSARINWAIKGNEGNWLGVPERIKLAGELWRERAKTPEEKLKISESILEIKERAKSGMLRDYELLMK
ncbi:hypothetical protein F52700_6332 [Fusarium sp. NRRL 52700]|nr:hypothetical protein F52700_6332 [Fusarium sp. NRRL 52700]